MEGQCNILVAMIARGMRTMHLVLIAGCALVGVVFGFLITVRHLPPIVPAPIAGNLLALAGAVCIAVGGGILRPRVPERGAGQEPEAYWSPPSTRSSAIFLWAVIEGGILLGWIGMLVSHVIPPAFIALLGLVFLWQYRPTSLQAG